MSSIRAKLEWFKLTILPHEAALRARLRRALPSRIDIDDLVAETMARAFATEDHARVTAGRAYIFQIARNLIIDEARRNRVVSFDQFVTPISSRTRCRPRRRWRRATNYDGCRRSSSPCRSNAAAHSYCAAYMASRETR